MNDFTRYSELMRKPTKLTPAESDEALALAERLGRDAEQDRAGCRRVGMLLDRYTRVLPVDDDLLAEYKAAADRADALRRKLAAAEGGRTLASKAKLDLLSSVEAVAEIFEGDDAGPDWFTAHVQSAAHRARFAREQAEREAKVVLK